MGAAYAHEPIIYGADGQPLVARSKSDDVSPMDSTMPTTVGSITPTEKKDDAPCYNVSGTVTRVERTPTSSGYAPDTRVPVRFAEIELREEDPIRDDSYGTKYTDADGKYSFSFCDDDGIGGGAQELYLRLFTDVYDPDTKHRVVYVEDSSYVDEVYEYNSEIFGNENGGNFPVNLDLTLNQSGAFNITDAIYEAWMFVYTHGGMAGSGEPLDLTAEVHWEPGYVELTGGTTFYERNTQEITIGTVSRPATWNESAIIHEYGHYIEHNYSCDESLGGEHGLYEILGDPEFAWAEGFNDYFQGAVRAERGYPEGNVYLDLPIVADIETWNTDNPGLVSPNNEMAIAALFWDLFDLDNDGQDLISYGQSMIQEVYTGDEFNHQWGLEDCTVPEYFQAWKTMKKPSNADTAAVIVQNTGVPNPFSLAAADANEEASTYSSTSLAGNIQSSAFQWWKHLVMIADVSKSMGGTKLDAVKTVLNEQVNDIAQNSTKGTEFSLYSFDNTKTTNNGLLTGKFYPELVTPAINSLAANAATDPTCQVESLRAMSQAIGPKVKGDAWLFTDGDALQSISVENLVKALNSRQIRGSFALLGGCNSATPNPKDVSGAAKSYLGLGANATQPGGIVPYLLTALGSGGKFLFVNQNQVEQAADIMRAQLSHSAGAGSWSDYVSTNPTYLYDKLNPSDYSWIDATPGAGGINQGIPNPSTTVAIPTAFPYFGTNQTTAHVNRYGYLTFGPSAQAAQSNNTALPNVAVPNNALYVLWEDLFWNNPPAVAAANTDTSVPNAADTMQVNVFTKTQGDWFAISTIGNSTTNTGLQRAYQILLNSKTGEIRYQYLTDINSAGATIGLENAGGTIATQVAFNDINGAQNNMGYKFIPALPQPTKTFTVPVDGLINSVGFLLTGYSGTFAPLAVRTPDNTLISCGDTTNVLCITSGLVQYVQVKVNGRKGNWQATVTPGASGAGTFSFSGIGASTINAESGSDRSRAVGGQNFEISLEKAVAGNQLDGWFTTPNGRAFGSTFRFYDDGAHNDDAPGDGRFGSDAFTPPGAGVAYLWVKGTVDGESFTRSEPTPFNFQPVEVTSLGDGVNYGDVTELSFTIKNTDSAARCFNRSTEVPSGWTFAWQQANIDSIFGLCIGAGATVTRTVDIKMAATSPNNLPSGATGDVVVTFIEKEEGAISDSVTASVTRHRLPAHIVLDNRNSKDSLRPNGTDTAMLKISAFDDQMVSVADGTPVTLTTTIGVISPTHASIQQGKVDAVFTTPLTPGTANITIGVGALVATTTLEIAAPLADKLVLATSKTTLPALESTAQMTVTITDQWGKPVAGQMVNLGVNGDGERGSVNGSETFTGTTNANGKLFVTFARGTKPGPALVSATLLVDENGTMRESLTSSVTINVVAQSRLLFLPQVDK